VMLHVCENGLRAVRPSSSKNSSSTAGESNAVSTASSTMARAGRVTLDGSKKAVTVYSIVAGALSDKALESATIFVRVAFALPAYKFLK
jgi:hypothetical protein